LLSREDPYPARSFPWARAARGNLLEDEESDLPWIAGGATFGMGPFQIVTLKLALS